MIASNDDGLELKINEPMSSTSLLKTHYNHHHNHHHESSGYSSKDAECSSPENKTHSQHRQHETKSRITANNNNNNNSNSNRTADIHRRRHKPSTSSSTGVLTNSDSLTIDESLIETHDTEQKVGILMKSFDHMKFLLEVKNKSQYSMK